MRNYITIVEKATKHLSQDALAKYFTDPVLYDKVGTVEARIAHPGETIATVIDGEIETTNTAKDGDMVIRGPRGEEYILDELKFLSRYRGPALSQRYHTYTATGTTYAVEWTHGDKSFTASWGEEMIIHDGDWLCSITEEPDGDLYRIEKEAFALTYSKHED